MRKNDIVLGIVFLVAVIGAGILAQVLHGKQVELAKSRGFVSKVPIAGFQKFMADIIWMRFLYYAGGNQLTPETADKYEHYIHWIIKLDPDFFRAYRDGALMLGPVDPEKALAIVDLGAKHPRVKNRWELPMMGGQIIMRKQWQGHYAGKEIDLTQVARAQEYFQRAKSLTGARPTALSSFIRTKALMKGKENDLPRELNELMMWKEHWESTRYDYDVDAMMPSDGEGIAMSGGAYQSLDIEQRIINQIKKVAKRYVQDPDAKAAVKAKAEELIQETIRDVFPGQHFDAESYIPYSKSSTTRYQDVIEDLDDKSYCVELDAPNAFAVNVLTIRLGKGSAKVSVLIDGKPVTGLENIEVKADKVTHPKLVELKTDDDDDKPIDDSKRVVPAPERPTDEPIKVRLPLHNNKGKAGSVIELKFSDVSGGAADAAYVLNVYQGDFF